MNEKWLKAEQKSERKYFVTSFCYGSTVEFLREFEDSKKKKLEVFEHYFRTSQTNKSELYFHPFSGES